MLVMTCRNHVKDYAAWHKTFASHREAHRRAGLFLRSLGRDIDRPNQIYFVFDVQSVEQAKGFIEDPENARIGAETVIDGEYHFIEVSADY